MPPSLQDAIGRLRSGSGTTSAPAATAGFGAPAGNLQAAIQSGRYLAPGSAASGALLARILSSAGLPEGTSPAVLSGQARSRFLQAAMAALSGVPRPMLSSLLGGAGLFPGRQGARTRLMGDGVPASREQIAASYALGGSPLVSATPGMSSSLGAAPAMGMPPPPAVPGVTFPTIPSGPFAGQGAYPGGPFGMPEPIRGSSRLTPQQIAASLALPGRRY